MSTTTTDRDTPVNKIQSASAWTRAGRALVCVAVAVGFAAAVAPAASAAPAWSSEVHQGPSNLPPGGQGMIWLMSYNVGADASTGAPTISFELPTGVTIGTPAPPLGWSCTGPPTVTCTNILPFIAAAPVRPHTYVGIPGIPGVTVTNHPPRLTVDVAPDAPQGTFPFNVTLSGGGAPTVTQTHQLTIGSERLGFGFGRNSFTAGAFDQAGNDFTQAGGHPYSATASFRWNTEANPLSPADSQSWNRSIMAEGRPRDVVAELPPGFIADPSATPKCEGLGAVSEHRCPPATQVGVATISPPAGTGGRYRMFGVFNIEPPDDAPAQLAFLSPIGVVAMRPSLRSDGDYGLSATVKNITEIDTLFASSVTLWGIPADASHDAQRCPSPNFIARACVGYDEGGTIPRPAATRTAPSSSSAPRRPLLSNPTECSGAPVLTKIHLSQYLVDAPFNAFGDPDLSSSGWKSATAAAPPVTGCERLAFVPTVGSEPTSRAPGSPTGLDFALNVPQSDDPNGLATAHLKDTTVVLPEGMVVNPSAADGLEACSSAQIGLISKSPLRLSKAEPGCPLASKIGTVSVHTPLLEEPLSGDVFLAAQNDNPFDSLLAIYLVIDGPGIQVKLAGRVTPDPQTGRLTTTVTDNPQLPFDRLDLHVKGGSRGPLTVPVGCGAKSTNASFTSWAGHDVATSDGFAVDCPGGGGFDPAFDAGGARPVAGAFTEFAMTMSRSQTDDALRGVDVTLPRGLLGKIKGIAKCPAAQAATGACPAASRVGHVRASAGAGSLPVWVPQGGKAPTAVYLGGPYKGAPLSLSVVVPAQAGPFDLGTVVVRVALFVDRSDGHVTAVADPLPTILQGIPLNVREVRVLLDRPRFTLNPTSCAEKEIRGDIASLGGSRVQRSARFQVGECSSLRFKPRLALRLTGRKQTITGRHPGVRAQVNQSGVGEAGIEKAKVTLPKSLALDPENAQALCEFDLGTKPDLENHCPKGSIVGRARAVTPLLDEPLAGNVYFVKNVRRSSSGNLIRTLPMIIVALRGEIAINLRGVSSTTGAGRLVNTFAGVPDAPIAKFNLNINGGANGILAVTRTRKAKINLCAGRHIAETEMDGQNGKQRDFDVRMKTPCATKKSAAAKRKAAANRKARR